DDVRVGGIVEEVGNGRGDLTHAHRAVAHVAAKDAGGLPLPRRGGPGIAEARAVRMVEVERLVVTVGVLDHGVVAPWNGRGALDLRLDGPRRRHARVEGEARARADVDVAVGVDAPIEGHVGSGGELQIHTGAVEGAELEEGYPHLAQDLRLTRSRPL